MNSSHTIVKRILIIAGIGIIAVLLFLVLKNMHLKQMIRHYDDAFYDYDARLMAEKAHQS